MSTQIAFYFDQSRCIGCYTCVAACRSWKQLDRISPDLIQIISREQGEFPNVFLSFLFLTCFHCAEPPCIPACPLNLIQKRVEDGIVVVKDPGQCTGCQICIEACPYGAPKLMERDSARFSVLKCDLCLDRLERGKSPVCVTSCPVEALDAGPMKALIAKYGGYGKVEGFSNDRKVDPSVIFRAVGDKSDGSSE